jgi:hypothetical protein
MIKLANLLKEIKVQAPDSKINAYFKPDPYTPTGYERYGSIKPENNSIIRDFLKEYQSKYTFRNQAIKELTAVIPRTVTAGLGIRLDYVFGYGMHHDVRDELIEFLKKRGIQAFGGMYDGDLVVWIPQENTNITRQD